jgi:hypothetical protein
MIAVDTSVIAALVLPTSDSTIAATSCSHPIAIGSLLCSGAAS